MNEGDATKRIAKNFFWLFFGNVLNGILAFLSTIYIARVLGAAAFGLFNFAQAFLLYLVLLVDSGLSILGTREISRDTEQAPRISLNLLSLRFIIAVIFFLICLGVIVIIPITLEMRLLFVGTFLFVFYRALNLDWIFSGLERMEYISIPKLLYTMTAFALLIIMVKGPFDLIKVPFINAVCGFGMSLLFVLILFKRFFAPQLNLFKPSLWPVYVLSAIPLGASMLMIQIYGSLDTIMLGFMDQPAVVGYYIAAYKIYFVFIGLYVVWQTTVIPTMNKKMKNDINQAILFNQKYTRLTLLAFVPLCLAVFLLAPLIVNVVYGIEYAAAGPVLQILIWTMLSVLIGSSYAAMWLIPAGKFNEFFLATAVGAMANIVLNIILIPKYSMYGAAVATVLAEVMAMLTCAYLAQKVSRLNLFKFILLPLLLSAISLVPYLLLSAVTGSWLPIIKLGFTGAVFLAVYVLLALVLERSFIFDFVKGVINKD